MSPQHQKSGNFKPNNPRAKKEKRPQLTHFLCLPLVNSTSLPQLESSLAAFKADIPPATTSHQAQEPAKPTQPLIPDAAIRPVGTLHLTLGVMSLPSKERLDAAIHLLQTLDLVALVREAETIARARAQHRTNRAPHRASPSGSHRTNRDETNESAHGEIARNETEKQHTTTPPSPFTISLESLHALPRARSATVLHAAPVDSTARLYPFCELLRDRFLDAGFLQGEVKNDDTSQQQQQQQGPSAETNPAGSDDGATAQRLVETEPSLLEEMPVDVAEDVVRESDPLVTNTHTSSKHESLAPKPKSKPKPRPLLLHATVVNTIYIKGRSRGPGGGGKSRKNSRYSFDARDLLARYKDYYLDGGRTIPRPSTIGTTITANGHRKDGDNSDKDQAVRGKDDGLDDAVENGAPNPFVWARDFPIESVCICEMGAKKLDPEGDEDGLNARLREKYMVVAEKSLDF
ncbi:uncharacterized protein LDX57_005968 [Aspergillus melleus]|uniref:uncharacterized protein n=1 Tax=Aspergillus melleus TaxID=138277 RepID=UPI001E8EEEA9|nr:uncharacterized protein LDX57_005968 [Aspergillus melleus]KAH8428265.1 hypothetical protein LDX57_005968 [Aspergillus melleus]